jgi:hypothetical protein
MLTDVPTAVRLTITLILKSCVLQDKAHCSQEATYTYHTAMNDLNFKMAAYIEIDFMFLHEV